MWGYIFVYMCFKHQQHYFKVIFLIIVHFRNDIHSGTLEVSPSIGLVVSQLKYTVEYFNREKHAQDSLLLQRNSLPTLSLDTKSI